MKTLKTLDDYQTMSPILKILSILTLYMFPLIIAPSYSRWKTVHKQRHKFGTRLSNPLIDDGIIYLCVEKNLLFFQSNGSIFRRIPLNYTCNASIPPVLGPLKMVYLVAENRVLRVSNTANTRTPESFGEVFLGPETGLEGMDEIIGLTVSVSGSCVLVNMHRRGLFAFRFDRRLKWSTGPFIPQNGGIHQGCRKNVTDCYFVSVPVLDYCDANFYIANNQGELYSVTTNSPPRFEWIQDLSSLGKNFTITSGNNGQLYVTVQAKPVIVALDVLRGTILWQQSIGSLSAHDSSPVVDVNGWVSIGSLDGFLYSISPSGVVTKFPKRKIKDTVIQVNPIVDCSGYAVYISQTKMEGMISRTIREYTYVSATKPIKTTITLLVPATGTVHWSESYPGLLSSFFVESDLRNYVVDERIFLAFISSSNIGNPLSCFSTRQKLESSCSKMDLKKARFYTGNEKAIKIFLIIETILLILVAALARFCCVFWKKKKLQNQDLGNFLEKRSSLRLQKKLYDRTINELEKKAAEGPSTNEMLEKIGDLVKERENLERKLLTTYSLVRDATSPQVTSLIPLSHKKTISDTSSEEGIISNEEVEKRESKGKAPMVTESDDDGGDHEAVVETQRVKILDEGDELQSGAGTSLRKRSRSLTRNFSSIE